VREREREREREIINVGIIAKKRNSNRTTRVNEHMNGT
jgi:hypothetical protein